MALNSTMYRFKIKVSDVDRGFYETIELRAAMHPSEAAPYFLTRIIAYCLNYQPGITFSQGISAPDEPALQVKDLTGVTNLWIDIGNPSAKRLHKAAKAASQVRIYTHRDPEILKTEMKDEVIHKREAIEIFSIPPKFLDELSATLDRDNNWELLHTEGEISIGIKNESVQGEITEHRL